MTEIEELKSKIEQLKVINEILSLNLKQADYKNEIYRTYLSQTPKGKAYVALVESGEIDNLVKGKKK